MGRTLMLLDAPSLVYRAFFALPTSMTDAQGRPVNAIRGFLDMTAYLVSTYKPDETIAAFDADWRPAFRVAAYDGYKTQRVGQDPPELPPQFDVVDDVLDAAGMTRVYAPGFEADDALATLVEGLPEDDIALVVSSDRDLVALVRDPNVRLLFTGRGVRKIEIFDEAGVQDRYGVPPALYADFATLRGDPSDGLPGVKGVGPSGAAELLRKHGSLDALLDSLDSLPPARAAAFAKARDYLRAMQKVVPLVRDAPLETRTSDAQPERFAHLVETHNLGGSGRRFADALGLALSSQEPS